MKTKLLGFFAASALALSAASASAAEVSASVFYDSLEPYGDWMETNEYGYVWHPRDADENWRPYTLGSWAYTDAGWTWVSEEPFGWATYHYGRWVELERVGWTWVPDRKWAPAWVSWRRSDHHVGWAPLPPEAQFQANVGFSGWVDSYYDIGPTSYNFVAVRDFGSPHLRSVVVQPRENVTIIRETRNITNITYSNDVVVNNGPEYDVIVRESAQPVRRLRLERRTDVDFRGGGNDRAGFAAEVRGDVLRVAAPEVEVSREAAPRKVARRLESVEVNRGWRNAGDPQTVRQLRTTIASDAKVPAELPPEPTLRGSDRAGNRRQDATVETSRSQAVTPESTTRTGAATTTTDTSTGKMKAGTETGVATDPSTTSTTGVTSKRGAKEKSRTTTATEDPADGNAPATATAGDDLKKKNRPAATAAAPSDRPEGAPESTTARQKRGAKDEAPAAASEQSADRATGAASRERMQRPGAKEGASDETAPAGNASGSEHGKKRGQDAATSTSSENADRPAGDRLKADSSEGKRSSSDQPNADRPEGKHPNGDRPDADRPENSKRPDAATERPDRVERNAPPAGAQDREQRKGPSAGEQRSSEHSRPEATDRSPNSEPSGDADKKHGGAGKSEKGEKSEKKDDEKKN